MFKAAFAKIVLPFEISPLFKKNGFRLFGIDRIVKNKLFNERKIKYNFI